MSAATPIKVTTAKGVPGRYAVVDSGDDHDAARIVLPRFRARLIAALGPDVIVAVPGRDLMTCRSSDFGNREAMVRAVEGREASRPHALTCEMFLVTKDRMVPIRAGWAERAARRPAMPAYNITTP